MNTKIIYNLKYIYFEKMIPLVYCGHLFVIDPATAGPHLSLLDLNEFQ